MCHKITMKNSVQLKLQYIYLLSNDKWTSMAIYDKISKQVTTCEPSEFCEDTENLEFWGCEYHKKVHGKHDPIWRQQQSACQALPAVQ